MINFLQKKRKKPDVADSKNEEEKKDNPKSSKNKNSSQIKQKKANISSYVPGSEGNISSSHSRINKSKENSVNKISKHSIHDPDSVFFRGGEKVRVGIFAKEEQEDSKINDCNNKKEEEENSSEDSNSSVNLEDFKNLKENEEFEFKTLLGFGTQKRTKGKNSKWKLNLDGCILTQEQKTKPKGEFKYYLSKENYLENIKGALEIDL